MASTISVQEFAPLSRRGGFDLIDVRTPAEFYEVHAVGALLTPLDTLNPEAVMQSRGPRLSNPLYIICRSGGRSADACRMFEQAGYPNVVRVAGGTLAWERAGLPVNRGRRQAISIDRQFRLTAGLLTLAGTLLAAVSPWFLIVPAVCGAQLALSGLRGHCGLTCLLKRAPWNGKTEESGSCCGSHRCSG